MGSVLQRQSDSAHPASPNSISQRQQENSAGHVQQGNHGFAVSAVQSSALSLPRVTKQEDLSLTLEQRARMDNHKAMALARRKAKLDKQQNQEELNRLTPLQSTLSSQQYTPVQSTLSSQQDNHLRSTLPPHRANNGGTPLVSTHSTPSSQPDVYCSSAANRYDLPSHEDIYGFPTLASTHQEKHTLISVHNSQPSQQHNQGGFGPASVQNPSSLQHCSNGGLALDSVHSCLTSQQRIGHSGSAGNSPRGSLTLQHDRYVGTSLTLEQRARMACEREKALAKLKERQKQGHYETRTSQCTIANLLSQESYQHGVPVELSFSTLNQEDGGFSLTPEQIAYISQQDAAAIAGRKKRLQQDAQPTTTQCSGETVVKSSSQQQYATSWFTNNSVKPSQSTSQNETQNFSTAMLSQQPQDSYRGSSNFVQDSHHSGSSLTYVQGLASSQQDTYSGSSLTQEQRAHMAHQKEMAIVRRNARLRQQQQDEHHHTHLTYAQCLTSSQDTYSGSSLTQEQRARMADQKEMAIARHNVRLRQQQQDEHHHMHHKPPNSKQGTAQVYMKSQEFTSDLLTNFVVDCSQSISFTQEQRALMAHQKEMAIARHNASLQQQQQEHHHMHHKPPNSKLQGTAGVGMNSQEFVTDLLPNGVVDCSQSASNQENGASLFQQEGDISLSSHQQIFSQRDDGLSFPPVQSYSSLQTNSDGDFSFTPKESSLSSQEDSYGASFLALTQNGHSASSRETFSLCSQECASILSRDRVAKCSQSLALHQSGAPVQEVSLHERNADNISLTPEQKAHVASQKERALTKRKMILEQRQLRQHHVNQPSERQDGCSQAPSPRSPLPRAGSWEYFSAECCDSLASDCCQIASQESQHAQK